MSAYHGGGGSVAERLEAALWSPGCTAFWLDPDRWEGVPIGKDGRLEPFWLYLDARAEIAKAEGMVNSGLGVITGSSAVTYKSRSSDWVNLPPEIVEFHRGNEGWALPELDPETEALIRHPAAQHLDDLD